MCVKFSLLLLRKGPFSSYVIQFSAELYQNNNVILMSDDIES